MCFRWLLGLQACPDLPKICRCLGLLSPSVRAHVYTAVDLHRAKNIWKAETQTTKTQHGNPVQANDQLRLQLYLNVRSTSARCRVGDKHERQYQLNMGPSTKSIVLVWSVVATSLVQDWHQA